MMASEDQQTDSFGTRLNLKKKRVIIITACILELAGLLVFVVSLVFGVGGYVANKAVANQVFKLAFWAGMPVSIPNFNYLSCVLKSIKSDRNKS